MDNSLLEHRLKWDLRFLELAKLVSSWSKDPSTQVGAVIADRRRRILSLGFNGPPQGLSDDDWLAEDRKRKLAVTIHAEENAILFANADLRGATIYTYPLPPCSSCAAKIRQSGITRVVAPANVAQSEALERWKESLELSKHLYSVSIMFELVKLPSET